MENIKDKELDTLVKGLKEMEANDFSIDSFIVTNKDVIRR
jgi:hypothetical protein